jgi:hypothetical protein
MSVAVFLAMAASAGDCSPRMLRTASSLVRARAAAMRLAMSASLWRITWKPDDRLAEGATLAGVGDGLSR